MNYITLALIKLDNYYSTYLMNVFKEMLNFSNPIVP